MLRNPVLGKDNVYRNFVSVSFRMPAKRGAKRGGKRGVRKRVVAKARRAPVRRRKKLKVRLKNLKTNSKGKATYLAIRPSGTGADEAAEAVRENIIRPGYANFSSWWVRTDVESVREFCALRKDLKWLDTDAFLKSKAE